MVLSWAVSKISLFDLKENDKKEQVVIGISQVDDANLGLNMVQLKALLNHDSTKLDIFTK